LSEMFSTLRVSEMLFSFHKLPNIHFFEHFLQIGRNVRIINGRNNMSGEKKTKLDTLAKVRQAMISRTTY